MGRGPSDDSVCFSTEGAEFAEEETAAANAERKLSGSAAVKHSVGDTRDLLHFRDVVDPNNMSAI